MALPNPHHNNRPERLEARISAQQKRLLQKAADLQGQSLTNFMLSHLQAAAERVIHDHEVIELNAMDSMAFVEALLNPPEPNEALRAAVQHYQSRISRP